MVKQEKKKIKPKATPHPTPNNKETKLEKDDYYCEAISFLPLRILISSWSITRNHRMGKFSDEQFSLHKKGEYHRNRKKVEALSRPILGRKEIFLPSQHKHELVMAHTQTYKLREREKHQNTLSQDSLEFKEEVR
jgi:hypothetical protein